MSENTNECVIEWIPGRDYVGLTAKNGSTWKNTMDIRLALQILKTQKSRGNHQSTCRKKLLVSG